MHTQGYTLPLMELEAEEEDDACALVVDLVTRYETTTLFNSSNFKDSTI